MTTDRRTFMVTSAAALATAAHVPALAQSGDAASRKAKIDAMLQKAADAGDVPGVVAVATDRNGTIYEGAFGKRVLGQPEAMTADTVVWIASMTKAVTGAAAMQLVEQGKLDLDAPAAKIVPDIAKAEVLEGFDDSGQPRTRKPKREITLRHLLTHTAGFSYDIWNADIAKYMEAKKIPGIISCQNVALTTPLLFDPGEKWDYGINIDWAGKMVEAVSGKRLGAYMAENLFTPLGMTSTAFKITPDMRARLAKIHQRDDKDAFTPLMDLEIPQEPEFEMGGGGLYSTAGDYLRFVRMILNRGKAGSAQVLKPETVDLMSKNNMGNIRVRSAEDGSAAAVERRGILSRRRQELGFELPDQRGKGPDRTPRRRPDVGGARQLLLLDRPRHRHRRGVSDAGAPLRRQEIPAALLRVRKGVLCVGWRARCARICDCHAEFRAERNKKGLGAADATLGPGSLAFALRPG